MRLRHLALAVVLILVLNAGIAYGICSGRLRAAHKSRKACRGYLGQWRLRTLTRSYVQRRSARSLRKSLEATTQPLPRTSLSIALSRLGVRSGQSPAQEELFDRRATALQGLGSD